MLEAADGKVFNTVPVIDPQGTGVARYRKTIIYNVVYGVPCTNDLHADGRRVGTAGYANEDCDVGRWWVDGDRWHRQWTEWVHGRSVPTTRRQRRPDQVVQRRQQLVDTAFIRAMVEPA